MSVPPVPVLSVVGQLRAQGFSKQRGLLSPLQVEAGRNELVRLLHDNGPGVQHLVGTIPTEAKARKIKDVAQHSQLFRDLASSDGLVRTMAAALGTDAVHLFSSTAWMKPAGVGAPKPPHQDEAHWMHVRPSLFVTCWIAFDAATADNGCLHFKPGSHDGPIHPHVREGGDFVIPEWDEAAGVPVELAPGDASFHLGRTVHWSGLNRSTCDRRGVAFAYCRGDADSADVDIRRLPRFTA